MAQSIQSESMHLITTDAPEPDSRGSSPAMAAECGAMTSFVLMQCWSSVLNPLRFQPPSPTSEHR